MQSDNRRVLIGMLAGLMVVGAILWTAFQPTIDHQTSSPLYQQAALRSSTPTAHAPVSVDANKLTLHANEGLVYYEEVPFTGSAIKHYGDDRLAERIVYVQGRKEGLTERWYPDGILSYRATYLANRRHGTAKTWWEDGTLRSESRYADGVADGVQRQWYQSGALFKELHLEEGREAGLQRAWRENGKLYANYEARDGRIFGLKRATLCFELEGEELRVNFQPTS